MSKRTREANLAVVLEKNNEKSPDVPAVILTAYNTKDAIRIAEVFEEVTQEDLPPHFKEWWKTVKFPVDLYFDFVTERQKNKFLKRAYKEIGVER